MITKHLPVNEYITLGVFFVAYILAGKGVIMSALKNIVKGDFLDENFLMALATVGAIAVGEYPEAVGVMIFFGIGEMLEHKAVGKSKKNIEQLMNIKPEIANLLVGSEIKTVDPEEVKIGDKIVVRVGEKVPLDGRIIDGESRFDTSAITGESVLRSVGVGEEIASGVINKKSVVTIEVTKLFEDSTVAKILEMVSHASEKKSHTENFIKVFAKYYTPVVVGLALAVALVLPMVLGQSFGKWIYRGMIFLVVSCPCALVISIPLSYFSGIGVASRNGILVKGSNYLEALKKVDTVVMDKTGTITKGVFEVANIQLAQGVSEEEIIEYALESEARSTHPIAQSIEKYASLKGYNTKVDANKIESYEEIAGHGIKMSYNGREILSGNARMMSKFNIGYSEVDNSSTKVYIAVDNKYMGCIEIADQIKEGMIDTIKAMKHAGIKNIVMLTGDGKNVAKEVASKIGITRFYADLLPNDKVAKIEEIMKEDSEKVAFIGDGINDAPVIARADVGISMGGVGSDAAIEASDIVFMTDEIAKMPVAKHIAKMTGRVAIQNIVFALGIKVAVLILSVFGIANMWMAIFADVGVTLLAILNSLRILRYREK